MRVYYSHASEMYYIKDGKSIKCLEDATLIPSDVCCEEHFQKMISRGSLHEVATQPKEPAMNVYKSKGSGNLYRCNGQYVEFKPDTEFGKWTKSKKWSCVDFRESTENELLEPYTTQPKEPAMLDFDKPMANKSGRVYELPGERTKVSTRVTNGNNFSPMCESYTIDLNGTPGQLGKLEPGQLGKLEDPDYHVFNVETPELDFHKPMANKFGRVSVKGMYGQYVQVSPEKLSEEWEYLIGFDGVSVGIPQSGDTSANINPDFNVFNVEPEPELEPVEIDWSKPLANSKDWVEHEGINKHRITYRNDFDLAHYIVDDQGKAPDWLGPRFDVFNPAPVRAK